MSNNNESNNSTLIDCDEEDDEEELDIFMYTVDDLPVVLADVIPIPQDDGPTAVCRIDYSHDFIIAHDYWRGMVVATAGTASSSQQQDKSQQQRDLVRRRLPLTALCLSLNPANYTMWHDRRTCIDVLCGSKSALEEEDNAHVNVATLQDYVENDLQFATSLGGPNPKNYQIWYHRRAMLERLFRVVSFNDKCDTDTTVLLFSERELEFIADVLSHDAKNYHAWSHRQWILMTGAVAIAEANDNKAADEWWQQELSYTHQLIQNDIRNNSAWNQRWFVVHQRQQQQDQNDNGTSSQRETEIAYALEQIAVDPYNESPWRYFIAMIQEQVQIWRAPVNHQSQDASMVTSFLTEYIEAAWNATASTMTITTTTTNPNATSAMCTPPQMAAVIDLLECCGDVISLQQAIELANSLATQHDRIRQKYWRFRMSELQQRIN